ncbi:uncharacterized protein BYT42DRAFT_27400 [Radiomyces spectabilis]|uniref:uncharacterized protein n=1 Tax=Radiomyces spectabilis TaxID=64574 RepID=UPI00221E4B43|nr:uncharacterized protein BYT42DRAFT_27400 [Radiomyces spectabilis]KAI8394002.1 hypothetical protein BYT42DRAFT_27400 [Radiomyces spectabilis]
MNKRTGTNEIAKVLLGGSRKYRRPIEHTPSTKMIWRKIDPIDQAQDERNAIIAFGNANFRSSMKGKRAAPTKRIKQHLQRTVVGDPLRSLENAHERPDLSNRQRTKLHAVLKCTNCGKFWKRDRMHRFQFRIRRAPQ